jgi:hypothetical protein
MNTDPLKEMYFGSRNSKAYLAHIPSKTWEFTNESLKVIKDNQSAINSLLKKGPLDALGKEYEKVYLPCCPSYEISFKDAEKGFDTSKGDNFISKTLIKTTEEKAEVIGYKSGKRSSVFVWKDKHYRLKGCGNLDEGFPIEALTSNKPDGKDIRGCQFRQTSLRE